MKEKIKTLLLAVLISFIGNYVILSLLPKLISYIFVIESNITSRFLIGILVRIIGIIITLIIIKKINIKFNNKFKIKYLLISWIFIVYILFNIEIIPIKESMYFNLFLMIIDAITVGFYEEILFRGLILNMLIKTWKKEIIIIPILISSLLFGLIHFMNLTSAPFSLVLYQVIYATIIGFSFSSLLIRINYNIVWCSMLHSLYDIAGGMDSLLPKISNLKGIDISTFIIGISTFIPLFIYSLFIIRKKKTVD